MSNESNRAKVHALATTGKLSLIAQDEAHLFHYWQGFRSAYQELVSETPFVCLTATASPPVKQSILTLLTNLLSLCKRALTGQIYTLPVRKYQQRRRERTIHTLQQE